MKGSDLRKLREKLGWTQVEMAKALFVAANTVARWERDERSITESRALMIRMLVDREKRKRA
jgi:transcriptional regulator with XRE-family HTH domain